MQPRQPVRTGHAHDAEVGLVDDGPAALERTLLGGRVAVVPGDPCVRAGRGDGARTVEQGADEARHFCARRADAYGWSSLPKAASSSCHSRSPSTNPYIRCEAVTSVAVVVRATKSVASSMRP